MYHFQVSFFCRSSTLGVSADNISVLLLMLYIFRLWYCNCAYGVLLPPLLKIYHHVEINHYT